MGPLSIYAENDERNVLVFMSRKPLLMAPLCPLIDTHSHSTDLLHFFYYSVISCGSP